MNRLSAVAVASVFVVVCAARASAHRLDEYLQALRVDVRADGVVLELDLTPGAALAPGVVAALDPDGNGSIGPPEQDAYVAEVMRGLQLTIDGRRVVAASAARDFPSPDELRGGMGVIRLVFMAELSQTPGSHRLFVENQYRADDSAHLANALRPETRVVSISAQRRDPRQRTLTIDYVVGRQLLTRATASWTAVAAFLVGCCAYWRRRR